MRKANCPEFASTTAVVPDAVLGLTTPTHHSRSAHAELGLSGRHIHEAGSVVALITHVKIVAAEQDSRVGGDVAWRSDPYERLPPSRYCGRERHGARPSEAVVRACSTETCSWVE